jgi:hypothetical protein
MSKSFVAFFELALAQGYSMQYQISAFGGAVVIDQGLSDP